MIITKCSIEHLNLQAWFSSYSTGPHKCSFSAQKWACHSSSRQGSKNFVHFVHIFWTWILLSESFRSVTATVQPMNAHYSLFHISKHNFWSAWCMTLLKISHKSSFLALQVGAPPVTSCYITTEIWLLKGDLLSKTLRCDISMSLTISNFLSLQ